MAATDNVPEPRLDAYRAKRRASETPEPFGGGSEAGGHRFVVQKHAASHLHYDFRLEQDGVLKSWAVPRGPSFRQEDKRLAVETEDHPVEYADFEGIIPEGNYGAGAVIVWDRGRWLPKADFAEGYERGKLLFELQGHKLRGAWTLVRIQKGNGREWLLIKERDQWLAAEDDPPPDDRSVFSGLLVEELRDGRDPGAELATRLEALGLPPFTGTVRDVDLMLAETRNEPFSDPGWVYELKYDGYRLLASREGRGTDPVLRSRNGHDLTAVFPDVAQAVAKLPYGRFVVDGEVVVHDETGRPSFQRLQKRGRLTNRFDIQQAAIDLPATYYAFDLVAAEGHDLRSHPLRERKDVLRDMLPAAGAVKYADHVDEQGEAFFAQVRQMGLEGMMAKDATSPYRGGRSPSWVKVRVDRVDDFVVVGFTDLKGTGTGVGALHLGQYLDGALRYVGRVGSGFTADQRDHLREQLTAVERGQPAVEGPLPTGQGHHWVAPELVAEVRYKEWTEESLLRHPVFLRFRDDKNPRECLRISPEWELRPPGPEDEATVHRVVPFSNLDKVFWPESPYTKGDLIEYYRAIAPWMLPYLRDRPVVMTRYPDGIDGKSFFQKDAPTWVPDWIRTEKVWSDDSGKETNYFIGDDVETLLYIANLGTIPLHVWSSRLTSLEQPDWCILDLDPKEAPFAYVVEVARSIRDLAEEIGLPCYAKTSGSTGIHALVPLGRQCTYAQSRTLGELLARVVAARLPDIATVARSLSHRQGRVYIDFGQNGHGKLLVAPFAVRPLPEAPVSMPLAWSEVNPELDLRRYTIATAPQRMAELDADPLIEVVTRRPDLTAALERLAAVV